MGVAAGFEQLFLGLLAIAEVAQDLGEADMIAIAVVEGEDEAAGPEQGAVFSLVIAFVQAPAFFQGFGKFMFGDAVLTVFVGEDDLGCLAADLFFGIAQDMFSPFVPAGDDALFIGGEDAVVFQAFQYVLIKIVMKRGEWKEFTHIRQLPLLM